uniref:Inositol hexakisphosphate and diphosphoinositol-pentakisphosphate kinase n=1 Tax=Glossina brevipalpis TaxID=37001 RepID=A0A1A9WB12_9MUSC
MGNSHYKFISPSFGANHNKNNTQKYLNTDLQNNRSPTCRVCEYQQNQSKICTHTKYGTAYGANLSLPWLINSSVNALGDSETTTVNTTGNVTSYTFSYGVYINMEWTWLKDWWRLKRYRSQHRSRKIRHSTPPNVISSSSHQYSDSSSNSVSDFERNDNEKFINVNNDDNDNNDENDNDNDNDNYNDNKQQIVMKQKHHKRQDHKKHTTIACDDENKDNKNALNCNEGVFNENDIDITSDSDIDEVNDFCYCDDCLNGDTDFGESNDGMDSDTSTSSNPGKQVVVGVCAMSKKTQSKPMKEIITRLEEFEFIKMVIFSEEVILKEPVDNWPICDCLISFHSKGFPLEKAIQYAQLRKPYVLNNLHMQYDIQDRRRVYAILEKEGIEIPRYAVLDRDSPDPKKHELIESEDHVEVNGVIFNKPFVEKPVSAEDHNIYIYYPTSAGGGSQRLFRKIGSRSSVYSPESRVRKTGSFIYEDFMPTDGTDVKVYTVGPDYAHAEARKSPALDGKVERDSEGKEIRYPVILNHDEKLISRKVCLAFKQTVCGFDLLRANGKSYVCDVNGFSFVKNSNKYYDDCAKILGNMILRELTPTLHIPWSVPFQLDDPPIVPTTFGKMMELRCVVAVIRHGDRTPKQKMKVEVRHPKFFEIFEKYDGFKFGHIKLKRPKQLQEILDIARFLLAEIETKADAEIEEKKSKLEQLKSVLEMYGHFSGINRKVQMKYQPKGRPRGSSSDDDAPTEPSLVLILKWGGELTPAGRIQAEELGRIFRCMYPGGQGRYDYSGTQGLGLLRLHSTFRHDLKIYASDEGRVQMTAAAFAKGLLALEGELTPILVQMVKSANTNGLLDNDCDSSKYQNMAKNRLHELMRLDREFSLEDRAAINPNNSISINQALDFVKNPVECCQHVHKLIKELLVIISVKKDDPKTKDAILYHGETWDLMRCRWEKIEKDFSTKSKLYDISKIPDIYDCIKYDLQHNQHTLQYDQAEELYIYAKYLADIVIPQEYGLTTQEKLTIGQGICTPLLKKIKSDLQRNIEEVDDESVNRLNPQYSHGVASPGRHVRTRLYFTSESHVHSLLTVLRYGGLLNVATDEQWRRAMDYISMVSELNYMSQIVIMLYEDPTKDPTSEERFHVELHFSPGVNCCVQKNLPPGPGFRPHSRNDSNALKSVCSDDLSGNPERIDEENDTDESPVKIQKVSDMLDKAHLKSKPIPIGAHHTVSGHEALDLAKRLNEELASQQQTKQTGSLEAARPISPNAEPRSRSYEQQHAQKSKDDICLAIDKKSPEIFNSPHNVTNLNRSAFQIRITDNLTFYKIDSSTNELPLSEIDFTLTPASNENQQICSTQKIGSTTEQLVKKQNHLLTMRRMESNDTPDYIQKLREFRRMSPLSTNERPLSCNCSVHLCINNEENSLPHNHAKSETDLSELIIPFNKKQNICSEFEEDFQISTSAPAVLLSGEFLLQQHRDNRLLKVSSLTNSPTASTLQLCKALEETASLPMIVKPTDGAFIVAKHKSSLATAQSAPVIVELANPFKFSSINCNKIPPIAENSASTTGYYHHHYHQNVPNYSSPDIDQQHEQSREQFYTKHQSQPHHNIHLHYYSAKNSSLHTNITIPNVVVTLTSSTSANNLTNLSYNTNEFNTKLITDSSNVTNHDFRSFPDDPFHNLSSYTNNNNNNNNNNVSTNTPILTITSYPLTTTTTATGAMHNNTITTTTTTTIDGNATSVSSTSSVSSSRRQRHSIAGQMSYMKMLGFGGFNKKMTTSANSLFSTAVISGSSSAPNLRDMIPVSSSVLEGFGGVPPIRPLETLHNALSLKQLDNFLEKMTTAPLFKTPTCTPPKNPSTPLSMITTTIEEETCASTPTNHICICNDTHHDEETHFDLCTRCGRQRRFDSIHTERNLNQSSGQKPSNIMWSKQSSIASSITEPSSPAISDTCSQETPSCEMSISLTSTEGYNIPPATTEQLAKFFPQLDADLNLVSVYAPLNTDTLEETNNALDELNFAAMGAGFEAKSACLTPVSFNMDLSIVANKGSLTLSVEGFEDDDDATPSAATPALPCDEPQMGFCYCCEAHINQGQPPDDTQKSNELFTIMRSKRLAANEHKTPCSCAEPPLSASLLNPEPPSLNVRKVSDPISPRIQKQISLFEDGEFDKPKDYSVLHGSINIPAQLKQDARLRKFENLTQSTSNSNFPFESNTLKRVPNNVEDFVDAELTQSCINLKSSGVITSNSSSVCSSPQHKMSAFRPVTQSCSTVATDLTPTSGPTSPRPGALIVREKFIEPPRRIARSLRGKTQSMDAEFLFNEFLLVPSQSTQAPSSSETGGTVTSPSMRPNKRFITTKVIDNSNDYLEQK